MGGDPVQCQTPLQVATRLQNSINGNQQLLAELKAAIWDKATDQERHPQMEHKEVVPAIAEANMAKTHAVAVLLDNSHAVLDVNNCIPQQVIVDTEAVCVMMSKRYAVAVGVNLSTLVRGIEFITADGALATSLGMNPHPIEFVLSRNTPKEHRLLVNVAIIDAPTYDILLGMEFIRAAKGAYDSYT